MTTTTRGDMKSRFGIATFICSMALVIATGCAAGPGQVATMEVHGVTVTCRVNTSSIQGADTLGPGPEAQTICRSRAREAVGTILASQPTAQVESVDVAANGSVDACYTALGVRTCTNILP